FRRLMDRREGKFLSAVLRNKCVNFGGDLGDKKIEDMDMFRNLLGYDPMDTQEKYQQIQGDTLLTAKHIITINKNPKFYGIWEEEILNRLYFISFKYHIIKMIDEYEKEWIHPKARAAILFWLIQGLKRYRKNGFTHPQNTETVRKILERETMDAFFDEVLKVHIDRELNLVDMSVKTTGEDLLEVDEYYTHKYGIQLRPKKSFSSKLTNYLKNNEEEIFNKREREKKERKYYIYYGLTIREEFRKDFDKYQEGKKESKKKEGLGKYV
ncbi:MAG: hypothetical protein HeimC3_01520, partial [Candidatus Heimdallarchaeota archaeon LC_3]